MRRTAHCEDNNRDGESPLPPPGRIALFFFCAAGEEQITENGDYRGSVVELVPPLTAEHALPNEWDYFDPAKADEKRECGLHASWGAKAVAAQVEAAGTGA